MWNDETSLEIYFDPQIMNDYYASLNVASQYFMTTVQEEFITYYHEVSELTFEVETT